MSVEREGGVLGRRKVRAAVAVVLVASVGVVLVESQRRRTKGSQKESPQAIGGYSDTGEAGVSFIDGKSCFTKTSVESKTKCTTFG